MTTTSTLLAMGSTPGQGQAGAAGGPQANLLGMFAPLGIIFVIFYFLLIRPQKNQQKKVQQMLAAMRKGDNVVTRGGIYGVIAGIADNVVTVEISPNVKIKMSRDAIAQVTPAA